MAQTKQVTITTKYVNNSLTPTTVSKVVEAMVVNDQLVADFRQINPGVTDPVPFQPQG